MAKLLKRYKKTSGRVFKPGAVQYPAVVEGISNYFLKVCNIAQFA
jgi:hypothetical protein